MRWEGREESTHIEDRRGARISRPVVGGLGTLVLALVGLYFGVDPSVFLEGRQVGTAPDEQGEYRESEGEAQLRKLVSVVLADTERAWSEIFAARGERYEEPDLVLFSEAVESACGFAETAVGPFYCPADRKVYLDLSFYEELRDRFGAPGDFAQAYVVAHEIGHHVQRLLGANESRQQRGARDSDSSVRIELQADCYAGIWAHDAERSRQLLEAGDIEEALQAAAAIGDDRLQMQNQGYVSPDSFTHGTSEQRVRWFRRGVASGSLETCDTSRADEL